MGSFPETNDDPNARRICSQSHIVLIMTSTKEWGVGVGEMASIVFADYYLMIPVSIGNSMI